MIAGKHLVSMPDLDIYEGDCRLVMAYLPRESVDCIVTSPPYWGLRDYGVEGQIGLEDNPSLFLENMMGVFDECFGVLKETGVMWVNLGDCYSQGGGPPGSDKQASNKGITGRRVPSKSGLRAKNLLGLPWRLALALQARGWYLRRDVIWHKPNAMPESCVDRPTTCHEYVFMFTKNADYWYDQDAVREPFAEDTQPRVLRGIRNSVVSERDENIKAASFQNNNDFTQDRSGRNLRSVWSIPSSGTREAHFATFPEKLVENCVLSSCPENGTVLDPFFGSGTTGMVARRLGRRSIGIELSPGYCQIAMRRLAQPSLLSLLM